MFYVRRFGVKDGAVHDVKVGGVGRWCKSSVVGSWEGVTGCLVEYSLFLFPFHKS